MRTVSERMGSWSFIPTWCLSWRSSPGTAAPIGGIGSGLSRDLPGLGHIQPNCYFGFPAAGKHTANSHHLAALVTPAGMSYECQAQQSISLASSDPQKTVTMILSAVHIQPFDIISDFVFSEGRLHWCQERERGWF